MTIKGKSIQPTIDIDVALRMADSWASNPRIRPQPLTARSVCGLLAAEVRRLRGQSPAVAMVRSDSAILEGLNYSQLDFMRTIKHCRMEIADYLRRGVEVAIVPNTEVPEAPPFALDVVENPSFWLDCFSSAEEARETAIKVGLRVRG